MITKNWSANLETEEYIQNRDLIVQDSIASIEETAPGYFVNLAVADIHGDPDLYLIPVLEHRFGDQIRVQFIDQCGCGGYVYRVYRLQGQAV
ncbi:CGCGG family rSAM-modified RiPP protein [Fodinisporobacter ferrooxydans]|uniref:CGCGG family rSAM-modified RiPP protein n=1 Tax=Fodinisporobacter ferrooxydans TaxID=2901836 RepID=A0ABY4CTF9_9BACL|nr:CGCGG family rSAM-modified RiPP protein [Alicyclobacillaceae bacterium MYW30-H2]